MVKFFASNVRMNKLLMEDFLGGYSLDMKVKLLYVFLCIDSQILRQ